MQARHFCVPAPPTPFPPSYEASPQCRLVREALCSLELPYYLTNVPFGSSKWEDLTLESVPFVHDPNTGFRGTGAGNIVSYLQAQYKEGETVAEGMADYRGPGPSPRSAPRGAAGASASSPARVAAGNNKTPPSAGTD